MCKNVTTLRWRHHSNSQAENKKHIFEKSSLMKYKLQAFHTCDLSPQNELKVAKHTLLVIPTKVASLITYSLKDAGFV